MTEVLAQGAEAILIKEGSTIIKHRIKKAYRIPALDVLLRRSRQRREEKVIATLAAAGVPVPKVIGRDEEDMKIVLSFIDGPKARDVLDADPVRHSAAIGTLLARMHKCSIAHGDPTTSNFIAAEPMHVIDFGLSFFTKKTEDYAVDLHLLRQVLEGTHTLVFKEAWAAALSAYVKEWPEGKQVIDWLETKVEKRGRNKKRQDRLTALK